MGRIGWRGRLLVVDGLATLAVVPWHRLSQVSWLTVVGTAVLMGPMFAWALIARTRRAGCAVGAVLLGLLALMYVLSQLLLSGPVRPPVFDWALPFVVLAEAVVVIVTVRTPRTARPADARGRDRQARRDATAVALMLSGLFALWMSYEIVMGDGAEPVALVEPYPAEILPLPPGWRPTGSLVGCGSGGCYSLTMTVLYAPPPAWTGRDPVDELRDGLDDRGYIRTDDHQFGPRRQCAPVGGLLPALGPLHWGEHCVEIQRVDSTTATILVLVTGGWPRSSP